MSESKPTDTEDWEPSLNACIHAAMMGGAFAVIQVVPDFNTTLLLIAVALTMAAPIFIKLLVASPELAHHYSVQVIYFAKFLIACSLVSAVLAIIRLKFGA